MGINQDNVEPYLYPTTQFYATDMEGNLSPKDKISLVKLLKEKELSDAEIIFLWCFIKRVKEKISSENPLFKEIRGTLKRHKQLSLQFRINKHQKQFGTRTETLHSILTALMGKKVIIKDLEIKSEKKKRKHGTYQLNKRFLSFFTASSTEEKPSDNVVKKTREQTLGDAIEFAIPLILQFGSNWYYLVK